jgi:hypothetical protein
VSVLGAAEVAFSAPATPSQPAFGLAKPLALVEGAPLPPP